MTLIENKIRKSKLRKVGHVMRREDLVVVRMIMKMYIEKMRGEKKT